MLSGSSLVCLPVTQRRSVARHMHNCGCTLDSMYASQMLSLVNVPTITQSNSVTDKKDSSLIIFTVHATLVVRKCKPL